MFTVCPKCALTLVVTAADLRVAQGYVRCGRCSSVFNALARLTDERQAAGSADAAAETASAEPDPAAPAQTTATPPLEADAEDEAIPEDALEFNPDTADVDALFVDPPANPQWTAATGSFKAMIAANQEPERSEPSDSHDSQVDVEIDAALLGSILGGEPAPPKPASVASEPARQPSPASSPVRATRSAAAPAASTAPSAARSAPAVRHALPHTRPSAQAALTPPLPAARTRAAPEPRRELRLPAPQAPADEPVELTLEEDSDSRTAGSDRGLSVMLARLGPQRWRIGAALALLLLAVQVVNHYRDELAATARFNRPLTALYSVLGVQLAPHWDLHAYDVRQLGASADAAGAGLITVRASIKNAASQPQPLPLLRVTLQDRFGNRIAARDVAPRFYVPRAVPATSFLSGGQRIDAEIAFVDPGANAVGFEIDACLPASGGGVACANDATAR
jgi:predicted Zn finger-like uncharacterized protein